MVVSQGELQVVRPHLDQRGVEGRGEDGEHEQGDEGAENEEEPVAQRMGIGHQGHGLGREHGHLSALDDAVENKGGQGGDEQHHAHHRAHDEILLSDDLLVDVHGQDVVAAAHHLWRAEVGEGEHEADKDRGHEAVFDARQGDLEEGACPGRAQGGRGLVQPGVGHAQGYGKDEERLRKGEDDLGNDDAHRAVQADVHPRQEPEEPLGDESFFPEHVDQGDAVEQRGREKGASWPGCGTRPCPAWRCG